MDFNANEFKGIFDKFLRLPTPYKLSIAPVISLVLVVAYIYTMYQPKQQEIKSVNSKYQKVQLEVATAQAAAANLETFKEELAQLELQLQEAIRRLPTGTNLQVFITDVAVIAKEEGVRLNSFKPGSPDLKEFYAGVPINLQFEGSYHSIARFFYRLSQLERIVSVDKLKLKILSQDDRVTMLAAEGTAMTYHSVGLPEQVVEGQKEKEADQNGGES